MSTVGAIIDRLYRSYLYPPDNRPPQCLLGTGVDASTTTIVLGTFSVPEDEELLNVGVQIEIGSELMQVTAYDENATTATVQRGVMGTTAAAHTAGDIVTISPPFTRQSAFEAVADNIQTLYPKIYTVDVRNLHQVGSGVFAMEDELAVQVVSIWADVHANVPDISGEIVDFHQATHARALLTNVAIGSVWVRYKRRFGSATSEADTLTSLAMEDRWVNIVIAGAAGDLLAGKDISDTHAEAVGRAFQSELVQVGTKLSLAQSLAGYRSYLLEEAAKEMRAEYRGRMNRRNVGGVVYRSPL